MEEKQPVAPPSGELLGAEDRARLLALARHSIRTGLGFTEPDPEAVTDPGPLVRPCGAFVSLHWRGKLRGCIGSIRASRPLWTTVTDMARSAAFQDPRFPPLTLQELPEVDLEISVLSPFEVIPVADVGRIEVGRHGLYISKRGRTGLLLPQVATDYGWERIEFLEQTCCKAGLERDEWREGAKIEIFSAEVFSEQPRRARR
jgi:AmmeMemoRadiSam system protein A